MSPRATFLGRRSGVIAACISAALVGALLSGFAAASVAQGHGTFSGAIGFALGLYGLAMVAAAGWMWRGSALARGPLIATGAVNLITAVSMAGSAPAAWVIAGVSAVTVVSAALPSTSVGLEWPGRIRPADVPPPTDEPRS